MVHGLFSFFFAMSAALILYLATPELELNIKKYFSLIKT